MRSFVTNALIGATSAVLVAGAVVALSGCISSAPIVPETPANQNQISTCQTTATLHNTLVLGDFAFGVGASTLGAVSAALPSTNASGKTDLAISAAVVAGAMAIGAGGVGFTAANFTNSNCGVVVGTLPVLSTPSPADAGITEAGGQ